MSLSPNNLLLLSLYQRGSSVASHVKIHDIFDAHGPLETFNQLQFPFSLKIARNPKKTCLKPSALQAAPEQLLNVINTQY